MRHQWPSATKLMRRNGHRLMCRAQIIISPLLSGTSEELLDLGDMRDERPPPLPHILAHPQGPLPLSCVFNGWHNDLMYVTVEHRTPQQAC